MTTLKNHLDLLSFNFFHLATGIKDSHPTDVPHSTATATRTKEPKGTLGTFSSAPLRAETREGAWRRQGCDEASCPRPLRRQPQQTRPKAAPGSPPPRRAPGQEEQRLHSQAGTKLAPHTRSWEASRGHTLAPSFSSLCSVVLPYVAFARDVISFPKHAVGSGGIEHLRLALP